MRVALIAVVLAVTLFLPIWQRAPKPMVVGRVQVRAEPALGCNV